MGVMMNDLKYIVIRKLFIDYFFQIGAELAIQLIDSTIKLYLESISNNIVIQEIKKLKGNEKHNVVKIISIVLKNIKLDFDLNIATNDLDMLYKQYQLRYSDMLPGIVNKENAIAINYITLTSIDYTYLFFRNLINFSDKLKKETPLLKFMENKEFFWGSPGYQYKLYDILSWNNKNLELLKK